MANYICRSGGKKKRNILRQKELALQGDIRREATIEKLHRTAEKVRSAHLGVIKVIFDETRPLRGEDEERFNGPLLKLEKEKDYWQSILVEEIVTIYSDRKDETLFVDRKKW